MAKWNPTRWFTKDELEEIIEEKTESQERGFDEIDYFYHFTKFENYEAIKKKGVLEAHKADLKKENSPIDGKLDGVFFCCTLFNRDLPDRSPHGNCRNKIPVEHFLSHKSCLFYNSSRLDQNNGIYYVTLVLADNDHSFCKNKLEKLDMKNNSFLRIDQSKGTYHCFSNQKCFRSFKLYVDVFVVGHVKLPEEQEWDFFDLY